MSDFDDNKLEQLLAQAGRRPKPATEAEDRARSAVRKEWQTAARRSRRRRATLKFAIAASILLAAFSAFMLFPTVEEEPVLVASIDRSFGSIHILGSESTLSQAENLAVVMSGQTIVTGNDSGLALAWAGGGSLRVDETSEIEFVDASTIELRRGRIYFDSTPAALLTATARTAESNLRVETQLGNIEHVGTQYMVAVDNQRLSVAVREGEVLVSRQGLSDRIYSGQMADVTGDRSLVKLDVATYGEYWAWVSNTSPPIDVDGRPIDEFLGWAGRELGLAVRYGSPELELDARTQTLRGTIDMPPRKALETWMSLTGFAWQIDEGVIYVSTGK